MTLTTRRDAVDRCADEAERVREAVEAMVASERAHRPDSDAACDCAECSRLTAEARRQVLDMLRIDSAADLPGVRGYDLGDWYTDIREQISGEVR